MSGEGVMMIWLVLAFMPLNFRFEWGAWVCGLCLAAVGTALV